MKQRRESRDGWGQAEKASLSRQERGDGESHWLLGEGVLGGVDSNAKALRWDHTLPGPFKETEGRPVGQRLVRERGPWTPGCPKSQGFGTDLRRACWELSPEDRACSLWGGRGACAWRADVPHPQVQAGGLNSPYCQYQPETPSGSHQASPDSESGGSFLAEMGSVQKVLVKSSLALCHLSFSRFLCFLGS